jgi:hypothetical protein
MAATFTRTNQFSLGQGVMLITGDLEITSAAAPLLPADVGVNKFIAVVGACDSFDGVTLPVLNSAGTSMTCFNGAVTDATNLGALDFPVGTYTRLSFLAV